VVPILYLLFGVEALHADVVDALKHFVPYFVVQLAIMAWMTERRVLPVMVDVSQLLAAHEVLRAVVIGLLRPKGQKFRVAAKGGDRGKIFVQWSMLKIFLVYLALTIAGVLLAFMIDFDRPLQESSALALFWSWYNIVILTVASVVCIEQPRKRKTERFQTREPITLVQNDQYFHHTILDISTTGMRLAGPAPGPLGTQLSVVLGGLRIAATIVRSTDQDFALRTVDNFATHKAMIKHVYGGRYNSAIQQIRASQVLTAVIGRVFR
jgi:cellulose synthase (UDP-forming)